MPALFLQKLWKNILLRISRLRFFSRSCRTLIPLNLSVKVFYLSKWGAWGGGWGAGEGGEDVERRLLQGCDLCRFRAVWCSGTTQHRGQATRNTGGRSEYSISFLAPLNHKERIRSLHHKIQSCRGRGWTCPLQISLLPPTLSPFTVGEQCLKHSFLHGRTFPIVVFFVFQCCQLTGILVVVSQQGSG